MHSLLSGTFCAAVDVKFIVHSEVQEHRIFIL